MAVSVSVNDKTDDRPIDILFIDDNAADVKITLRAFAKYFIVY